MTGQRHTKSGPVCARGQCGKVLFAPISCKSCNQQFCPQHRFPDDHNCASNTATAAPTTSKLPSQQISEFSNKASAAGSATLDAVKKKWAATTIPSASSSSRSKPAPAAPPKPHPKASSNASNPFSKTDRSSPVSSSRPLINTIIITDPIFNQHSSPVNSNPNPPSTPIVEPVPVIDPMLFVPRPIFASA